MKKLLVFALMLIMAGMSSAGHAARVLAAGGGQDSPGLLPEP